MATEPYILIVDDDPNIVYAMERVFATDGYRVRSSGDGASAIEAVNNELPDLVFMDITMPGLTGLEVLER